MITSAPKLGILTLVKNMHGFHVAMCYLECLLPKYKVEGLHALSTVLICNVVYARLLSVALCIQFLIEAVMVDFVEVAKDPYESFALQECSIHCDEDLICEAISVHWIKVAYDKYGSHTLEKWLSLCDDQQINRFLDRLNS